MRMSDWISDVCSSDLLFSDHVAIGTVRSDRARRTPPGPADAVQAWQYATLVISKSPPAMLIRHALHGRRRVANATHHQAAIDAVAFACSTASQLLVQFSALDDDAFDLAVAFDGHRHGEKVEIKIGRANCRERVCQYV